MTRRVSFALLFSLVVAVGPIAAQLADDRLIVPGKRIGKWTLDMTTAQLVQLNGPEPAYGTRRPPNIGDLVANLTIHWWPAIGFMAAARDDQQLLFIGIVRFSAYGTDKGVSAGMPEAAIVTAYGPASSTSVQQGALKTLIYDEIGLGVLLDSQNLAHSIYVFRSGDAGHIWKK